MLIFVWLINNYCTNIIKQSVYQYLCEMKVIGIFFLFILTSCYQKNVNTKSSVLDKNTLVFLLKEIHLYDSEYKINKQNGISNAQLIFKNKCDSLFTTHNVNAKKFNSSIKFYSNMPENLEDIYSEILDQLTKEKTILNQQ